MHGHVCTYGCVLANTPVKSAYRSASLLLILAHWASWVYFELICPVCNYFNNTTVPWFSTLQCLQQSKVSNVQQRRTHTSLIPTGLLHIFLYLQILGKQSLARLANPQDVSLPQNGGLWLLSSAHELFHPVHKHINLWDAQEVIVQIAEEGPEESCPICVSREALLSKMLLHSDRKNKLVLVILSLSCNCLGRRWDINFGNYKYYWILQWQFH